MKARDIIATIYFGGHGDRATRENCHFIESEARQDIRRDNTCIRGEPGEQEVRQDPKGREGTIRTNRRIRHLLQYSTVILFILSRFALLYVIILPPPSSARACPRYFRVPSSYASAAPPWLILHFRRYLRGEDDSIKSRARWRATERRSSRG
jgi:hypothetical protein